MSTQPKFVGHIILTAQLDGSWQPDWDGRLHSDGLGPREAVDAMGALGPENVRLVACIEVPNVPDPERPAFDALMAACEHEGTP